MNSALSLNTSQNISATPTNLVAIKMNRPTRNRNNVITAAATLASTAALLGTLWYLDIPSFLRSRVKAKKVEPRCYSSSTKPSLLELRTVASQETSKSTYPLAERIEKNIPIYDCHSFDLDDEERVNQLQDELYHNLLSGPGVYVLKHFFDDLTTIAGANEAFEAIINNEVEATGQKGDHFAPASANSRIWDSFSKHALHDPESFAAYFSNPWFRLVCESYLGPQCKPTLRQNPYLSNMS